MHEFASEFFNRSNFPDRMNQYTEILAQLLVWMKYFRLNFVFEFAFRVLPIRIFQSQFISKSIIIMAIVDGCDGRELA